MSVCTYDIVCLILCSTSRARLVGKMVDLVKRSVVHLIHTSVCCGQLATLYATESRHYHSPLPCPLPLPSPPLCLPSQVAYLQSTAQQLKDLGKLVKSLPDPAKQAVKWFSEHSMKM